MQRRHQVGCPCCGDPPPPAVPLECCGFTEEDVLSLYFHESYRRCNSPPAPPEYPAGTTISLVYKTELRRSSPVFGPAEDEITGFIEDKEPASCGGQQPELPGCIDDSTLFGFGEISTESCTLYTLGCSCVQDLFGGTFEWWCERARNYLPWTTDLVSCDPLLIDFYEGSTKMATITRA